MKLVEMECPQCGAPLKVDADGEKAVCGYCGHTLLIEREETAEQIRQKEYARAYGYHKGKLQAEAEAEKKAARWKPAPVLICLMVFAGVVLLGLLVNGLGELAKPAVDPFACIAVSFRGTDGRGELVLEELQTQEDLILSEVDFEISKERGLSQGEKVRIRAESDTYRLTQTERVYTVSGLDEYITSFDGIPREALDLIHSRGKKDLIQYNLDRSIDAGYYVDMKPVRLFLLTDGKRTNRLYDAFAVDLQTRDGVQTFYGLVRYKDVVVHAGEQISLNMSSGSYVGNMLHVKGAVYFVGFSSLEDIRTWLLTGQETPLQMIELEQ